MALGRSRIPSDMAAPSSWRAAHRLKHLMIDLCAEIYALDALDNINNLSHQSSDPDLTIHRTCTARRRHLQRGVRRASSRTSARSENLTTPTSTASATSTTSHTRRSFSPRSHRTRSSASTGNHDARNHVTLVVITNDGALTHAHRVRQATSPPRRRPTSPTTCTSTRPQADRDPHNHTTLLSLKRSPQRPLRVPHPTPSSTASTSRSTARSHTHGAYDHEHMVLL